MANPKLNLAASVQAKNGRLYAVIQLKENGKTKPVWRTLGLPEGSPKTKVQNSILRLGHIGVIEIVVIMGKRYCAKENFIEYLIRPEVTLRPQIGNYKEIIGEFKKQQYRVRENEVRRQRRAAERVK